LTLLYKFHSFKVLPGSRSYFSRVLTSFTFFPGLADKQQEVNLETPSQL